jgi:hypothetical protein
VVVTILLWHKIEKERWTVGTPRKLLANNIEIDRHSMENKIKMLTRSRNQIKNTVQINTPPPYSTTLTIHCSCKTWEPRLWARGTYRSLNMYVNFDLLPSCLGSISIIPKIWAHFLVLTLAACIKQTTSLLQTWWHWKLTLVLLIPPTSHEFSSLGGGCYQYLKKIPHRWALK